MNKIFANVGGSWKAFSESEELNRTKTMQKRRAEADEDAREKTKKKKGTR